MRVLVVEDDERLCDVFREFLLELGHQPLIAHTAEGAMAKLRTEAPGAMLLDIRLPGMSGLEFLRLQSTRELGIPIVVVSGTMSEGDARECLRLGAVDFLGKPVMLEHLKDVLACLEPLAAPERHELATPTERRRAPRTAIELPVRVREYGGNQWDATAVDLSVRGIKVRSTGHVTPAAAARLSFALPEGPHLELTSVLVRANVDGYAFHFVNLQDWQLERLRDFIERSTQERRGAEPHLRVLQSIAQAVGRSLDVDKMLRLALHALTHVTGHEASSLHLLSADGATLHLRSARGLTVEEQDAAQTLIVGEDLVGRVAATGRSARVSAPDAAVCVPLESRGHVIGTLSLLRRTAEPFSDAEVALLEAGANQIALALDNSRLYGETRRQLEDLERAEPHGAAEGAPPSTLGKLAAGLVHEINNPLTAILAQAELLMTETDPASKARERLRVVVQETSRAARLLKSVLQLSRPRRYERQPCSLDAEVGAVLDFTRPQLEWAGITVVTDLQPVPTILADRDQLRQLLLNLVQNARQAMAAQSAERVLTVRTRVADNQARAEVLDTGPGIPPEALPRIFDAFFTTKAAGEGTGLGLWVSYDIAEQHGGRLHADNRPDGGAIFTLDLPLAPA
ncbi:MAG TPA: ATP-binding protein [Methylomirabilota bacterium]|nr:ATP-binding protein [Methylomirabilota bacterium]